MLLDAFVPFTLTAKSEDTCESFAEPTHELIIATNQETRKIYQKTEPATAKHTK
jgi:hypothetical protein